MPTVSSLSLIGVRGIHQALSVVFCVQRAVEVVVSLVQLKVVGGTENSVRFVSVTKLRHLHRDYQNFAYARFQATKVEMLAIMHPA